jgi:peptidase MA superfamily protein
MGRLMLGRRRTNPVLAAVMALGLLLGLVPHAVAASSWTFGTPTADSTFGKGIVFNQPITIDKPIGRVEILLTFADAVGPTVFEVPGLPAGPSATLTYTLDTSGNNHLIPNTPIVAQWRVISADEPTEIGLGPELRVVYDDDRFTWKSAGDDIVRVHWYEGNAAFGAKALKLGADEVRETAKLLGVTERDPIDFFVYANVDDFYAAIGPGAHENVAGSAFANIRTLLGLIPPDQINDSLVAVRIPHEFVHMVFDTASKNPYHSPPRWLNEGLAVYQSEAYGSSDRGAVESAARNGTLIPLDGLTGQFPNGQDFFLAYSESVSAVEFMIRTYGPDALVTLIRSYAEGRTDDEAFSAALGLDMTAFSDAWFKDVNATPKTKFGPQPAPPGPVPSAWTGAAPGGQASGPPSSQGPAAGASGGATPPPVPAAVGSPTGDDGTTLVGVIVAIGVIVLLVAVALAARRRRTTQGSP